jgi:hypothetical protein
LAHHVHRVAQLGSCVIINAGWYNMITTAQFVE